MIQRSSFGSFMSGMGVADQQFDARRQRAREQEMLEDWRIEQARRRQREDTQAERDTVRFGHELEDRTRRMGWEDEQRADYRVDRAHTLERRPIMDQQQDSLFGMKMRQGEQSLRQGQHAMRMQSEANARARMQANYQNQLAKLKLDEAKLAHEHANFAARIGAPARRFAITGDPRGISSVWRELTGGDGELVLGEDGQYYAESETTGRTPLGTRDEVIGKLSMFSQRPEAYLALRYELEANKGRGAATRPTTLMQNTEYLRTLLPQEEGESERDYNARLLDAANRARSRDPESEFRSLIARIMERQEISPNGKVDKNAAVAEAREIMGMRLNSGSQAPAAGFDDGQGPFTEGERITGPDGKKYVVRNGEAVRVY